MQDNEKTKIIVNHKGGIFFVNKEKAKNGTISITKFDMISS